MDIETEMKILELLKAKCPFAMFLLTENYRNMELIYFQDGTVINYLQLWKCIDKLYGIKAGYGHNLQYLMGNQYLGTFNCRFKDFLWPKPWVKCKP